MSADLDGDVTAVPGRRVHPVVKLAIGLVAGAAAIFLVVSTAGGIGDAGQAIGRMRGGFVALAALLAFGRLCLCGLQLLWLGRRTGSLSVPTALGLALVVYGSALRRRRPREKAWRSPAVSSGIVVEARSRHG